MEQYVKRDRSMGARIRDCRKARKWTQEQMIAKLQLVGCGMLRGTYGKIEAGLRHVTVFELCAIATVLDTTPNDLLGFEQEKEG